MSSASLKDLEAYIEAPASHHYRQVMNSRNNHLQVGMRAEIRLKLIPVVKKGDMIQRDRVITDGLKSSPLQKQIYNATRKKFTLWKREKYLPDSQERKDCGPTGETSVNGSNSCFSSNEPSSREPTKNKNARRRKVFSEHLPGLNFMPLLVRTYNWKHLQVSGGKSKG